MANENKHISDRGISVITYYEGCYLEAYWDPYGKVWTIGYGHTNGVYEGMVITQEQAIEFLKEDCLIAEKGIKDYITRELKQYEFDALVSFLFNVGEYTLYNDKTLRNYVNSDNSQGVYDRLQEYVYGGGQVLPGLVKRRKTEGELYRDNDLSSIGGGSGEVDPPDPPNPPTEGSYRLRTRLVYGSSTLFPILIQSTDYEFSLVSTIGDIAIIKDSTGKVYKTNKKNLIKI
ncbi:lysozyme [Clostridium paraputrificum]|uniref:lysozyme n=1 Tax=Clostridium paraputrificum TaxID=29363 RepID=UPI001B3C9599|nr:lysozyme [Clostridium paraputrificum]